MTLRISWTNTRVAVIFSSSTSAVMRQLHSSAVCMTTRTLHTMYVVMPITFIDDMLILHFLSVALNETCWYSPRRYSTWSARQVDPTSTTTPYCQVQRTWWWLSVQLVDRRVGRRGHARLSPCLIHLVHVDSFTIVVCYGNRSLVCTYHHRFIRLSTHSSKSTCV